MVEENEAVIGIFDVVRKRPNAPRANPTGRLNENYVRPHIAEQTSGKGRRPAPPAKLNDL